MLILESGDYFSIYVSLCFYCMFYYVSIDKLVCVCRPIQLPDMTSRPYGIIWDNDLCTTSEHVRWQFTVE